jgi:hypothetical protein
MMEITTGEIENKIYTIRNIQVMTDRDLAEIYGVDTKRLNEQVKRNIERFPEAFRFQLTENEKDELVANCDRLKPLKYSSSFPFVFTEQGVSMLAAVLRSKTAIATSIQIINSFVQMRHFLTANADVFKRLEFVEKRQRAHEIKTDEKFEKIFDALEDKSLVPKQGIFFDGQIFDAYIFVSNLIKNAEHSIILIDNYIDETVLTMLDKRIEGCTALIYTKSISKKLRLDLEKHNAQYPPLEVKPFAGAHDRFLIIDDKDVYHIGASLKDLGKKWFAFSKMDKTSFEMLEKLKGL